MSEVLLINLLSHTASVASHCKWWLLLSYSELCLSKQRMNKEIKDTIILKSVSQASEQKKPLLITKTTTKNWMCMILQSEPLFKTLSPSLNSSESLSETLSSSLILSTQLF